MKVKVEVPYGDVDAMGHLNNVAYLKYLECGAPEVLAGDARLDDFWDIDFVVAHAEIDYRSSVSMGEMLEIEIHVSRWAPSSFDFSYRGPTRPERRAGRRGEDDAGLL